MGEQGRLAEGSGFLGDDSLAHPPRPVLCCFWDSDASVPADSSVPAGVPRTRPLGALLHGRAAPKQSEQARRRLEGNPGERGEQRRERWMAGISQRSRAASARALIDEVFKSPISPHPPSRKRPRKGREAVATAEQKRDLSPAICCLARCSITTLDGNFAHRRFT